MGFFGRDKWETDALVRISAQVREVEHKINDLIRKAETIMATQAEAAAQLNQVATQIQHVGEETQTLLDLVKALQDAAANDQIKPELQAAIDAVAAQAKVVDDKVPDVTPPTT